MSPPLSCQRLHAARETVLSISAEQVGESVRASAAYFEVPSHNDSGFVERSLPGLGLVGVDPTHWSRSDGVFLEEGCSRFRREHVDSFKVLPVAPFLGAGMLDAFLLVPFGLVVVELLLASSCRLLADTPVEESQEGTLAVGECCLLCWPSLGSSRCPGGRWRRSGSRSRSLGVSIQSVGAPPKGFVEVAVVAVPSVLAGYDFRFRSRS